MRAIVVPLDGSTLSEPALHLASAIARRTAGSLRVTTVAHSDRPEPLVHAARECEADLVVVPPRDDSDAARARMAHTASQVAKALGVPVLVTGAAQRSRAETRGTFRRVLVPLDGSPHAELALEGAAEIAGRAGVEYTLLRVAAPLHPVLRAVAPREAIEHDAREQRERCEAELADAAARFAARGFAVRWEIREDPHPDRGIVAHAATLPADLVSLTTHARSPVGRLLVGSVAPFVVQHSPAPVLLTYVRPAAFVPEQATLPVPFALARATSVV